MTRSPPMSAAQRWAPWAIGAVACAAYAVVAPSGAVGEGGVWRAIAWIAEALPFGEPAERVHGAAAACAGAAAAILAWLTTTMMATGGGGAAATAGAVAAAAVMVGAGQWDGDGVLLVGLALAAVALAQAIATGAGAWPGVGAGVALGLATATDRVALVIAPVVVAVWAIRWRYGARWAVIAPVAAAAAWTIAMIPAWRAGVAPAARGVGDARYAIDLADAIGAPAAVAGAVGLVALVARRRTRWIGMFAVAMVVGGVAVDRLRDVAVGPLPIAGLALAAGVGVARLARLVRLPVGQACVGGAAAVIVAAPAVLAML